MKLELTLLSKNTTHALHLYEAQLSVDDINDLESHNAFIFPVEQVYSVKQLLAIIHLVLDNSAKETPMVDLKTMANSLFYGRKKPFRSYYNRYIIVFLDSDPSVPGKKNWDFEAKSLKDKNYCDIAQVKKVYGITERQAETSGDLDEHICSAVNQLGLKNL